MLPLQFQEFQIQDSQACKVHELSLLDEPLMKKKQKHKNTIHIKGAGDLNEQPAYKRGVAGPKMSLDVNLSNNLDVKMAAPCMATQ